MDGFLLINKPEGYTSRQVGSEIGKLFQTKKVGHIGTLDPFATGLLILSINKGTKAGAFFDDFSKKYIATLKLGVLTDTLDKTGKVIKEEAVKKYTKEAIEKTLCSFLGRKKQTPPMTSAVRINGKKLYELAHKGIEIDRPSRDIEIYDIKLLNYDKNEIKFSCHVSKGTYIRVLGKDIAETLGTCGHLIALERTGVGPFNLDEAITLKEVKNDSIRSVASILARFSEVVHYDEKLVKDMEDGKIAYINYESKNDKLLVLDMQNNPVAMYTRSEGNRFVFKRGLF